MATCLSNKVHQREPIQKSSAKRLSSEAIISKYNKLTVIAVAKLSFKVIHVTNVRKYEFSETDLIVEKAKSIRNYQNKNFISN